MAKKEKTKKEDIKETEEYYDEDETKKSGKLFVVLSILIALVIIVVGSVLFALFFCNIQKIELSGNTILVDEEIKQDLIVDDYDKNAVFLVIKNIIMPRKDIPFVESMEITMKDLNTVSVKIKEKEIVGFILDADKNRIYYNSEGKVQEISKVKVDGAIRCVPEGELSQATVGSDLPIREKSRRELVTLHRELSKNDIHVRKIEITEEGNFILHYRSITIKMGTSSNMAEKVLRLKYILPKVKKKSGTLHLEDWSEGNKDIVFEMTQ